MRIREALLLAALAGAAVPVGAGCESTAFSGFNARTADWFYVEETFGGLTFGEPAWRGEVLIVPVALGDPPPTRPRPGVALHAIGGTVEGDAIVLTLTVTTGSVDADALVVASPEPGTYRLVARDSDGRRTELGTLRVPERPPAPER